MDERSGHSLNKISVVVLSYNRPEDLEGNLSTLLPGADSGELDVIVVDNASDSPTRTYLEGIKRSHPGVKVVLNSSNLGVAGGRNIGFNLAAGEIVISLDDDSCMQLDDIRKVPSLFAQHPDAGILAFRVRHARTGAEENPYQNAIVPVANFHGAAHAIHRKVFEKIGYLDEECSFGGEELDYSIRCHAANLLTLYVPDIIVAHNSLVRNGAISVERRKKWLYNYNRLLFKHFPRRHAYLFAYRYNFIPLLSGYYTHGLSFVPTLLKMAWAGSRAGRRAFCRVPDTTVRFYKNPDLRPELGNVPLRLGRRACTAIWKKLRGRSQPLHPPFS
jgi:GT2 family glycosyltransferase